MGNFFQDIRYAVRSLRKSPGLVAVAALSLALGVAVNVTIFAGVDILLMRPLPYPNGERLLAVWSNNKERGWDRNSVSSPDFADWRAQAKGVSLAAFTGGDYNLADGDRPERVGGLRVSPNFFSLLGVAPARGRLFQVDEELPGRGRSVILSDDFWRARFAADTSVLGRTIRLDGEAYTVVGIMPQGFRYEFGNSIYTPFEVDPTADRGVHRYQVIGLLRPGVTLSAANTELNGIATRLAALYPKTNFGNGVTTLTLQDQFVGANDRRAGFICLVAVMLVLLIACSNVANLLLARAAGRNRELAVRTALGAERGRIISQLVSESLLLALVGGAIGLALSIFGIRWLKSLIPPDFSQIDKLRLDARAVIYALFTIVLAGLAAGLAPALQVTKGSLTDPLKDGGRGGSIGLKHGRLRAGLVVAQMSLALVLLISAGLLIKGTLRLTGTDIGFDPGNTLTFAVTLSPREYPDTTQVIAVQDQLQSRLAALPGVTNVGAVTQLPMNGGSGTSYYVEGEAIPEEGRRPILQYRDATPGFFDALKIPVLKGRDIGPQDRMGSQKIILINETLARRHWPKGEALGHRLVFGSGAYDIVGIVRDVREFGPDDPPPAIAYFSAPQYFVRTLHYTVRTAGDPMLLVPRVREEVRAVARDLPAYGIQTMRKVVDDTLQGDRIMPKLLGLFGGIALLLSLIGVYGVMAYSVSQRTQELGIRRALGAGGGDILGLVLRQGTRLAGIGALIGLGLSAVSTKALSAFLYGVSAFDPFVFSGVTVALLLAALVASLLPARRATRVDPLVALRSD